MLLFVLFDALVCMSHACWTAFASRRIRKRHLMWFGLCSAFVRFVLSFMWLQQLRNFVSVVDRSERRLCGNSDRFVCVLLCAMSWFLCEWMLNWCCLFVRPLPLTTGLCSLLLLKGGDRHCRDLVAICVYLVTTILHFMISSRLCIRQMRKRDKNLTFKLSKGARGGRCSQMYRKRF